MIVGDLDIKNVYYTVELHSCTHLSRDHQNNNCGMNHWQKL